MSGGISLELAHICPISGDIYLKYLIVKFLLRRVLGSMAVTMAAIRQLVLICTSTRKGYVYTNVGRVALIF